MDFFPELEEFGWCPFARVAGKPCILCGGTRAVFSFLGGDFNAAWQFHPIVVLLFPAGLLLLVFRYIKILRSPNTRDWRRLLFGSNTFRGAQSYSFFIVGGALMWAWNFGRW
jgi:hypothetical protein